MQVRCCTAAVGVHGGETKPGPDQEQKWRETAGTYAINSVSAVYYKTMLLLVEPYMQLENGPS